VAESETSTRLHGKTRSFFPLGQSCFCRERLKTTKEVKLVFSLGFWCFPLGFAMAKEGGWLAVAALGGLLQSGQQNRANGDEKQASNLSLTQRQM